MDIPAQSYLVQFADRRDTHSKVKALNLNPPSLFAYSVLLHLSLCVTPWTLEQALVSHTWRVQVEMIDFIANKQKGRAVEIVKVTQRVQRRA